MPPLYLPPARRSALYAGAVRDTAALVAVSLFALMICVVLP